MNSKYLQQLIVYEAVRQYMNERLYLCGFIDENDIDEIHLFTLIVTNKLYEMLKLENDGSKEALEIMGEDYILANADEFEEAFERAVNKSIFAGVSKGDLLALSKMSFDQIKKRRDEKTC